LVGCLLTLVAGRDADIKGGSHRKPPVSMELSVLAAKTPGGQIAAKVLNASRLGSHLFWCEKSLPISKRQIVQRWKGYEAGLEERLADLHSRIHRGTYRAQASRRIYIPKADGRQRPLGIAALEDKIVQQGVT
jgi:hypothetical protein